MTTFGVMHHSKSNLAGPGKRSIFGMFGVGVLRPRLGSSAEDGWRLHCSPYGRVSVPSTV